MSDLNGIVTLEELPEKEIFVELEERDKLKIKKKIRKRKDFYRFLLKLKLRDWFYSNTEKLRLDKFHKILELFNIHDIKIKGILGKQGVPLKYPKFPFDFTTKDGVRFISCLLGDGCIHSKGIRYYNQDENLINEFLNCSKSIFGYFPFKRYEYQTVTTISLPKIFKYIMESIGFKSGSKTSTNPRIPKFIFDLPNDKKIQFISQFIDDDGYISGGKIGIDLGFDDGIPPFLLYDIGRLLRSFNIKCSIFPASDYYSLNDEKRVMWRLLISLYKDTKKLSENLILNSLSKRIRCEKLIKLNKKEFHKGFGFYLEKLIELHKKNGFFTTIDLANASARSMTHSRRIIRKLEKLSFIELVDSTNSGYKRYKLYGLYGG